ncbi:MAG TPA: hypothetical protein VEU62_15450 [Bryobacterales bacterium]|nr:hypothetical protein [Bryobacterales bacterium]
MPTQDLQKVTVLLPKELVRRATRASGAGLTPTIREGLEAVVRSHAYRRLRQMRGRLRLSLDVRELRRD